MKKPANLVIRKLRKAVQHIDPIDFARGIIPWICISLSAYNYLETFLQVYSLARQFLILLACLICTAFVVYPLIVWTYPWVEKLTQKEKLYWITASIIASVVFLYAIPIPVPGLFYGEPTHNLKIRGMGDKNPSSQGSEVWLLSANNNVACQIPFSWLQADPSWKIIDNSFVSKQEQPGNLLWKGYFPYKRCRLIFLTHPWSGYVMVTLNGKSQVYDLYAPEQSVKEVVLEIPNNFSAIPGLVSRFSVIGSLCFFILVISLWLANRRVNIDQPREGWKSILIYALPLALWWGIYLIVFWPGLMSVDSFVQWRQINTGMIDNWHPAFHTLTIYLLRIIWNSPAMIALTQILCLAIMSGVALHRLVHLGANRKLICITLIIFMICPANSFYIITLWKDIFYSIAILGFFICFVEIVYTKGGWIDNPLNSILLVIGGLLASLYRHNGSLTIWLSLAVLVILIPQKRGKFIWLLTSSIFLWWIITGPLYTIGQIKPMPSEYKAYLPSHHIAAHLAAHTPLTEDEETFLNRLRPIQDDWSYTCYCGDPTIYSEFYDYSYLKVNLRELFQVAFKLALRDPKVEMNHLLCTGNELWRVTHPFNSYIYTVPLVISPNGLSSIWKNDQEIIHIITAPRIEKGLIRYHELSRKIEILWLTWRPALYFYLFIFGVIIASVRKRDPKFLLLAVPIIFQETVLFLITTCQDFRFHYPVLLIGMLYIPYLLFNVTQKEKE